MWDSYWASSRAIGDGLINEYPLWSWLFADLHAHVLVMPVSLLSLSLIALLYQSRTSGVPIGRLRTTVLFGLLAVLFGTMLATNIWDFVAYGGVLAVVLVAILRGERQGPHHRLRFEPFHEAVCRAPVAVPSARLVAAFLVGWVILWPWLCSLHPYWLGSFAEWWIGLLVGAVLVVVSQRQDFVVRVSEVIAARLWSVVQRAGLPGVAVLAAAVTLFAFFVSAVNTNNASLRFNTDGNIALGHALRHFGVFAIVTVSWLVVVLSARPRAAVPVVLATVAITGAAALSGWWGTAGGAALYALLATAAWMTVGVSARDQRWTGVLLTCGWGVAAFSELVVLNDRMNTVFKFYHPAWMLLAVGSAGSVAALATRWRVQPTALRAAIAMTFVAAMAVAIAGSYRAVSGVVTRNLKPSATPTLDGLDFLRYSDDERELGEATEWLNHHGGGGFAVGEAFTNTGYDDSARVAKYTGLPIVLGWPHHLSQRGHNGEDIAQRARDLVRVYTTRDPQEFAALTSRYRLRYLLVGDLERQHYSGAESALRSHGSVREVFRSVTGRYVIFEVTLAS
jgi:uncharacterized membrane protein